MSNTLTIILVSFGVLCAISIVYKLYCYIKYYSYFKKTQPMTFTIGTKTNLGTMLYTSGRVVSISFIRVVIDGYQLNKPQITNGEFTIEFSSISGIGPMEQKS